MNSDFLQVVMHESVKLLLELPVLLNQTPALTCCSWERVLLWMALISCVRLGLVTHCGCGLLACIWSRETFMVCFQETGLYEYKVFGVLTTCSPELCADVYMDLKYRKTWDGYVKGEKRPWGIGSVLSFPIISNCPWSTVWTDHFPSFILDFTHLYSSLEVTHYCSAAPWATCTILDVTGIFGRS